jgi:hypothetical protein
MPLRAVAVVALLGLLASSAGCIDLMMDQLESSRDKALERDAQDAPAESTGALRDGPWPWPGSYVHYALQGSDDGDAGQATWSSEVRLAYDGHRWNGTCEGSRLDLAPEGTPRTRRFAGAGSFMPLLGPAEARKGDVVTVQLLAECRLDSARLLVQGVFLEDTVHDGEPTRTRAWHAGPAPQGTRDGDAWWDESTRLLLRWEVHQDGRTTSGRMTGTDAPVG